VAGRRPFQSGGGMAGWIYADLTLLLFVVGLASWSAVGQAPDEQISAPTTLPEKCGGATPKPIEAEFTLTPDLSDADLFGIIASKMRQEGAVNARGEVLRFNIVLAYAGTGTDISRKSQAEARSRARDIAKRLENWDRFTDEYTGIRWSEDLLLIGLPQNLYRLTIFPLFCED